MINFTLKIKSLAIKEILLLLVILFVVVGSIFFGHPVDCLLNKNFVDTFYIPYCKNEPHYYLACFICPEAINFAASTAKYFVF